MSDVCVCAWLSGEKGSFEKRASVYAFEQETYGAKNVKQIFGACAINKRLSSPCDYYPVECVSCILLFVALWHSKQQTQQWQQQHQQNNYHFCHCCAAADTISFCYFFLLSFSRLSFSLSIFTLDPMMWLIGQWKMKLTTHFTFRATSTGDSLLSAFQWSGRLSIVWPHRLVKLFSLLDTFVGFYLKRNE